MEPQRRRGRLVFDGSDPSRTLTPLAPSRMIVASTTRLCGGKEGRPLGLKHVALRIAGALSLVGTLEALSPSCMEARGSTRLGATLFPPARLRTRLLAPSLTGTARSRALRWEAASSGAADPSSRAVCWGRRGQSKSKARGGKEGRSEATLFPTVEPGYRRRDQPRRTNRVSVREDPRRIARAPQV